MYEMRFVSVRRSLYMAGFVPAIVLVCVSLGAKEPPKPLSPHAPVGRVGGNVYLTPTGQAITPAGRQVELPGMRPQALALSPDGRVLVTSGKTNGLVVIDLVTGLVRQRVSLATNMMEK